MSGNRIFLFLSTPRSGTQWVAATLARIYGDVASVNHEPIGPAYRPREFLRAYGRLEDMLTVAEIRDHLARVAEITTTRTYVELGWQNYAAIPLLVREFGSRVGVIQLARHPVTTAQSLVTQNFYEGSSRDDDHTRMGLLDPWCPGVAQKVYSDTWAKLSPYEKCLFYWTEIYLYAEELRKRLPGTDFLATRMEDLVGGDTSHLKMLTSFLGLPFRDELTAAAGHIVDERRKQTDLKSDWREILQHPTTTALATRLGYDMASIDERALRRRYRHPLRKRIRHSGLAHAASRLLRRVVPSSPTRSEGRTEGERPHHNPASPTGHSQT